MELQGKKLLYLLQLNVEETSLPTVGLVHVTWCLFRFHSFSISSGCKNVLPLDDFLPA